MIVMTTSMDTDALMNVSVKRGLVTKCLVIVPREGVSPVTEVKTATLNVKEALSATTVQKVVDPVNQADPRVITLTDRVQMAVYLGIRWTNAFKCVTQERMVTVVEKPVAAVSKGHHVTMSTARV